MQEERFKRRMEEELKIEEMKLDMEKKNEDKDIIVNSNIQVKLSKLAITKFEGTHLDWFRFWNQFEAEIDKAEISAISKFPYLREFLVPKLRALIDGLPFTPEGYARTKSILLAKFGKPSETAAAHIQCITSLPVVSNSNPNKIHKFYEKLIVSVRALDAMHKLKDIKGYVRLTLNKLPLIRTDLVRLDDEWKEWDFPKLLE